MANTRAKTYDVCKRRRYSLNILQWEEKSTKCRKRTTGDYYEDMRGCSRWKGGYTFGKCAHYVFNLNLMSLRIRVLVQAPKSQRQKLKNESCKKMTEAPKSECRNPYIIPTNPWHWAKNTYKNIT